MRAGAQDGPWQRPLVRRTLVVTVVLLSVLLAGQVLLHGRDRIAASAPAMRPALLALCAVAQCKLAPLRQIESVAIESSSFTMLRPETYKLAFSLRNAASFDVAMPAIELSLTDTQDQPVIRRVLLPTEFGAKTPLLGARADWSTAIDLQVAPEPGTARVAGYRLLAFYP